MSELEFKIDGPALREGVPIPIAISALGHFQTVVDKTYLVATDGRRMTAKERERFFLRATEFQRGSFIAAFDIALQGVQIGLPLVSSYGPQNIWDLTKSTFSFLKTVCGAVQNGREPGFEFNNQGDVSVNTGEQHYHYHGPVYQIGRLALSAYQDLSHIIGPGKLNEIAAGRRGAESRDIFIGSEDRNAFDVPTKIQKETTELKCEVFDFNKYKNAGKLQVAHPGQDVPQGSYNFTIFGNQDSVDYIYSMLKSEVALFCLVEEATSPFGGQDIVRLHVTGVGS